MLVGTKARGLQVFIVVLYLAVAVVSAVKLGCNVELGEKSSERFAQAQVEVLSHAMEDGDFA